MRELRFIARAYQQMSTVGVRQADSISALLAEWSLVVGDVKGRSRRDVVSQILTRTASDRVQGQEVMSILSSRFFSADLEGSMTGSLLQQLQQSVSLGHALILYSSAFGEANRKPTPVRPSRLDAVDRFLRMSYIVQPQRPLDLSWLDMRGLSFVRSDLYKVSLISSRLSGADMSFAILRDACLVGADFSGARLFGASMIGVEAAYASFSQANLRTAQLEDADVQHADFTCADLRSASLRDSITAHARFLDANLAGADLHGCGQLVN